MTIFFVPIVALMDIVLMENYIRTVIKYPSEIKVGDFMECQPTIIGKVVLIEKGIRHSRENGYPYHFTCNYNNTIYQKTYYKNVVKYIKIKDYNLN